MSETKRRPGGHPGMRGPGVPGEKAKDFRGSLGKLIRHCKPFYPVICIAILGDLAGVIIRLIGPNKISEITNLITAGLRGEIDMPAIQKICITLIILYVVGALLSFMTGLVMTVVTQKVNRGLRDGISHKSTACRSATSSPPPPATCSPASPTMWTPSARRCRTA